MEIDIEVVFIIMYVFIMYLLDILDTCSAFLKSTISISSSSVAVILPLPFNVNDVLMDEEISRETSLIRF